MTRRTLAGIQMHIRHLHIRNEGACTVGFVRWGLPVHPHNRHPGCDYRVWREGLEGLLAPAYPGCVNYHK